MSPEILELSKNFESKNQLCHRKVFDQNFEKNSF